MEKDQRKIDNKEIGSDISGHNIKLCSSASTNLRRESTNHGEAELYR